MATSVTGDSGGNCGGKSGAQTRSPGNVPLAHGIRVYDIRHMLHVAQGSNSQPRGRRGVQFQLLDQTLDTRMAP